MQILVRPHRMRRTCRIVAAIVLLIFCVAALLLGQPAGGAAFGPGDQIAMVGMGLLLAAAAVYVGRPALKACDEGLLVRNLGGDREIPWAIVRAVRFRDGSPWASLDLLDDESVPLLAVQAADGERTVVAVAALRELLARHSQPSR